MLASLVESQNALCRASIIHTQSSIRYGQKGVTLKLPDKCSVNKVSVTMFRSNPAVFAGNRICGRADQMKKGSQNVPVIFPLRNMIKQTAKTGKTLLVAMVNLSRTGLQVCVFVLICVHQSH